MIALLVDCAIGSFDNHRIFDPDLCAIENQSRSEKWDERRMSTFGEFVVDDCYFVAVIGFENVVQQCGFASSEKPCQNGDWDLLSLNFYFFGHCVYFG